ncbi:unnamed protein product, partial [marine sediment metagenome]
CKSNELEEEITDIISHDKNLMALSTRKDIDSIINHVVVESKPYAWGAEIDIGIWEIAFSRENEAQEGKEYTFGTEEPITDFRFDLTWSIEGALDTFPPGDYFGSGSYSNFTLPLTRPDGREGIQMPIAGPIGTPDSWGEIRIETVNPPTANSITVKFYLICEHPRSFDDKIVFSASLTCHAEGIGQPKTYSGEAIDEMTYQDRFIGRRKRTFTLDYLEPGDTQARQAAERILAGLRRIRVYYDCEVRGMPHLRLMNTVPLTEPKANLCEKKLQVIKLVDNMQVANYTAEVGLMERKIASAVPWYWETAEHDFIINTQEQLIQTFKFVFDSEITSYKFNHNYSLDATIKWGKLWIIVTHDCHGEGSDENFDLPYSLDINVYSEQFPDVPLRFGTLTINLIEETSTSVEVEYKLAVEDSPIWDWFWPIDWLGTLSIEAQFASQSPGTDPGDAPSDQPHYP